jgi:hypothetical protein
VNKKGNILNAHQTDNVLNGIFTMFVLSMVMASVIAIPVIIAPAQAATAWRLLKKS